jgi:hypothetical protein
MQDSTNTTIPSPNPNNSQQPNNDFGGNNSQQDFNHNLSTNQDLNNLDPNNQNIDLNQLTPEQLAQYQAYINNNFNNYSQDPNSQYSNYDQYNNNYYNYNNQQYYNQDSFTNQHPYPANYPYSDYQQENLQTPGLHQTQDYNYYYDPNQPYDPNFQPNFNQQPVNDFNNSNFQADSTIPQSESGNYIQPLNPQTNQPIDDYSNPNATIAASDSDTSIQNYQSQLSNLYSQNQFYQPELAVNNQQEASLNYQIDENLSPLSVTQQSFFSPENTSDKGGLDFQTSNNQTTDTGQNTSNPKPPGNNRRFYIISGIIIAFLLVSLGVVSFLVFRNLQNNNNSATLSISSQSVSDNSISSSDSNQSVASTASSSRSITPTFTDPNGPTPAMVAKKFDVQEIPSEWLRSNFSRFLSDNNSCNDNQICGTTADPDRDGLTNIEEYNYQTNPNDSDTDKDGIADGDEVKIFSIDPTKKDSTNSGTEDFSKLKSCFDPALRTSGINNKISNEKKSQIAKNVSENRLHEPTITNLKKAGATDADLRNGYLESACGGVTIDI